MTEHEELLMLKALAAKQAQVNNPVSMALP